MISQAANDLIIACEVSSRAYYEKKLRRPEWPGERSGVTIAIGYDLGYAAPAKIKADWGDRFAGSMVDVMLRCSGVTGRAAKALLPQVRGSVDIPWDDAIYVYEHVDIPDWERRVCAAIPGADKLTPDCLGALTSLAYNRGASFQMAGDRYREMRAIRSHIMAGELSLVGDEIRSMERLWPNSRGLRIRREKEADLWSRGLRSISTPPTVRTKPYENPPPLTPPSKPGTPEIATGAGSTAVLAKAAQQAHASGLPPWEIAGIVVGGVVVAGTVIAAMNVHRNQPVLARAKG